MTIKPERQSHFHRKEAVVEKIEEKSLMQMEALLHHSARGVHILFDNQTIARILRAPTDQKVFLDVEKIKLVQDILTKLITKRSYNEKLAFLDELDPNSMEMLVRTYFHIVENTIRASTQQYH
ncbi:MAG: hypothetical protein RJB66_921 [Pseudomonadota bacterium]|jgi:hypothetical protein